MIQTLNWDSDFFGYSVGAINIEKNTKFDISLFNREANNFKLVYLFSDQKLTLDERFLTIEEKVVFRKELSISTETVNSSITLFNGDSEYYNKVLELCYLSGTLSRFNIDPGFKNNEFKRLYKKWLDKCLASKDDQYVFVKKVKEQIAGIVTLERSDEKTFKIGLIAVDPEFQKRGIGSELIDFSMTMTQKFGANNLEVTTQNDNLGAMKTYHKAGFQIKSIKNVYHFRSL